MLDKNELGQYVDLLSELEDLRIRIRVTEGKIAELQTMQTADSVTHGKKGKRPLKRTVIRGVPVREIEQKMHMLRSYRIRLKAAEIRAGEMVMEIQEYINGIEDSRIRRLFTYRYVDKLTWAQVAVKMGGNHTAEGCRKSAERYLDEEK